MCVNRSIFIERSKTLIYDAIVSQANLAQMQVTKLMQA